MISLEKPTTPAASASARSSSSPAQKPWTTLLREKEKEWFEAGMGADKVLLAEEKLRAEWVRAQEWPAMPVREG